MTNKKVKSINSDSISKRFDFAEKDVSFRNKWNDLGIHNYDRSSPREKIMLLIPLLQLQVVNYTKGIYFHTLIKI